MGVPGEVCDCLQESENRGKYVKFLTLINTWEEGSLSKPVHRQRFLLINPIFRTKGHLFSLPHEIIEGRLTPFSG